MPGHHLVPRNARKYGVHDRPLRSGRTPATLRFSGGEFNHSRYTQGAMESFLRDENAAPDNVSWFSSTLQGSATQSKIHRRLPFARRPSPATNKMRRRCRTTDEQHPDKIIHPIFAIMLSPTQIVQSRLRRKTKMTPQAIGQQCIQPSAFIDFVE